MPGASAGLPSQYIDLGGGVALNPSTGQTFIYDPTATSAGQAGQGIQAYKTGVGTLAGITAQNPYGSMSPTGIFSQHATGLPGMFPGTSAMPNPFLSHAVPLSGMVGMMDPYLVTPGLQNWMPAGAAGGAGMVQQMLGIGGAGAGGFMSNPGLMNLLGQQMSPGQANMMGSLGLTGAGAMSGLPGVAQGMFPSGSALGGGGGGLGGYGLQMSGGAPNIIPGGSGGAGGWSPSPGPYNIPGYNQPVSGFGPNSATMPGLRQPHNAITPYEQAANASYAAGLPTGQPGTVSAQRASELAARGPVTLAPGERLGPSAASGGTQFGEPGMAQLMGQPANTAGGLTDQYGTGPNFSVSNLLGQPGTQMQSGRTQNSYPGYTPSNGVQYTQFSPGGVQGYMGANIPQGELPGVNAMQRMMLAGGAPHAGSPLTGQGVNPSTALQYNNMGPGVGMAPGVLMGGGPGGGGMGGPSTAGPFAPTPAGLGANLLLNEIGRREGWLNTSEGIQTQALDALLQSPVTGGVNTAVQELLSNPFPGSSPERQQAAREATLRRYGQAAEGAKQTMRGTLTEQGLRGGESSALEAGVDFRTRSNIADALNMLDQQFAATHVAERQALQQGLGQAGATQLATLFNPMMDVSSFYERRSSPEISALLQLLGQQEALNAAQQVAKTGAAGPGGVTGSTAGAVSQQQLLQLLGLA